jgi:hypothetical protein
MGWPKPPKKPIEKKKKEKKGALGEWLAMGWFSRHRSTDLGLTWFGTISTIKLLRVYLNQTRFDMKANLLKTPPEEGVNSTLIRKMAQQLSQGPPPNKVQTTLE